MSGLQGCSLAAIAWLISSGCAAAPPWEPAPRAIEATATQSFRGGTGYEVYVRSFADSDGDGIGDLRGLTAHLDYLNDGDPDSATSLGVEALYLMPIFGTPGELGYDITDYRSINPDYGTLEDFDALVAAAHRRGIYVILDMVINHTSSQHPWFLDSSSGPTAARRDWYLWRDSDPGWPRPWDGAPTWHYLDGYYFYGIFSEYAPDLNLGNPAVEQEMTDMMKFWLARGADAFRLDALSSYFESDDGHLEDQPETHAYLRRMRATLDAVAPELLLIAEVWKPVEVQASYYGNGDEANLGFSFELADVLKTAGVSGDSAPVIGVLMRSEAAFAGKDRGYEAPFLSNHDQVRLLRALAGDRDAERVLAAVLFAMPGTPFVYYGQEIGMLGGELDSGPHNMTPFRWTPIAPGYGFTEAAGPWTPGEEDAGVDVASEQADAGSLWHLYRRLIALRRSHPSLRAGDAVRPIADGGGAGLLALLRALGPSDQILFVANLAKEESGPFTVDANGHPAVLLAEGMVGVPSTRAGKLVFPGLAAHGFAFASLRGAAARF